MHAVFIPPVAMIKHVDNLSIVILGTYTSIDQTNLYRQQRSNARRFSQNISAYLTVRAIFSCPSGPRLFSCITRGGNRRSAIVKFYGARTFCLCYVVSRLRQLKFVTMMEVDEDILPVAPQNVEKKDNAPW